MEASFEARLGTKEFWKTRSTLGKVRGWRRQLLIRHFAILYYPTHLQTPACVDFQMAMHEPYTWIVSEEANSYPTAGRHTYCVSFNRIYEIEFGRVLLSIKVPKTLTNHKEIEAMKVQRVAFNSQNTCIL